MELDVAVPRGDLKLNPKKIQFKVKQVTWMGHLLSSTRVSPHPDRVKAIKDMTPPHDVKGLQRFLGMCYYLSRCNPNLAEVVKPLTELTHGNVVWSWSSQHDKNFKTAKSLIVIAATLKSFDVNKPCVNLVPRSHSVTGNVRSGKVRFRACSVPARPEIRAFLSLRMFVLSVVILGDFAE